MALPVTSMWHHFSSVYVVQVKVIIYSVVLWLISDDNHYIIGFRFWLLTTSCLHLWRKDHLQPNFKVWKDECNLCLLISQLNVNWYVWWGRMKFNVAGQLVSRDTKHLNQARWKRGRGDEREIKRRRSDWSLLCISPSGIPQVNPSAASYLPEPPPAPHTLTHLKLIWTQVRLSQKHICSFSQFKNQWKRNPTTSQEPKIHCEPTHAVNPPASTEA